MTTILDDLEPAEDYFDAAQGLYWYAAAWHSGQSSELYSILSTLGYSPAPSENGPDTEYSQLVYEALEAGEVDASDVRNFVDTGYAAARD